MQAPLLPPQTTACFFHAGRPEASTMHPQPLQLASARKLLQYRIASLGLYAHTLRPARLRGRRGRPPRIHLIGLPARPASSAGTDRQRSTQQAAKEPCPPLPCRHTACSAASAIATAATQPASHVLHSCCGRQACARRRPLDLAACSCFACFAPSLYHRPHRARTAVERRRRRVRCAPSTAGHSVCWACLPRARAALAA